MKAYWTAFPFIIAVVFLMAASAGDGTTPSSPGDGAGDVPVAVQRHLAKADPDDCLTCHDDDALTMERNGREVSVYVDPTAFDDSPHGGLDCVDCHEGYDPDEEPHRPGAGPVDCATCHDDVVDDVQHSQHASELTCTSCHQNVHTPAAVIEDASVCATCHDAAVDTLKKSVHDHKENGPGCFDCHEPHQTRIDQSEKCMTCHGDDAFVSANVPGQQTGFKDRYESSVHYDNIDCSDCHGSHLILAPDSAASPVSRHNIAETCSECHDDVAAVYQESEHGKALASGFEGAPTCTDCHGEHDIKIVSEADSRMSRQREVATCLSCHADTPEVRERMTHTGSFVAAYEESVHGRAWAAGNMDAAICSDCHGAHRAMKASHPDSKINKFNIAETCGQCHDDVEHAFEQSIHGQALSEGVTDAPTCTTCHGEHTIMGPEQAESPVAAANVSEQVCSPCHDSYRLSTKYGFPKDRTSSFGDSFHGLAGRFGDAEVANCASCHGVHDILPSSDPRSKVNPANLAATCGTCHPGANVNFTKGKVHVVASKESDLLLYWISRIYIFLIVAIIGFMLFHNAIDWVKKTAEIYRRQHEPTVRPAEITTGTNLFLRMTVNERFQHAFLAVSFLTLVVTGFMLKFPDAWWVRIWRDLLGQSLFELRGLLHRIAAVVMIAVSFYHLYYVIFTSRGRRFLRDIMLRWQDLKDMQLMLRHNLGLTERKPHFGRFNYIEKSEYWALIWGTIIMSATGIALWFENQFMSTFSKVFVDASSTIHYYEAWLAFLAIVVWHFYYVIFNPDAYPINLTWLKGTITEEEMEREHPKELEEMGVGR